MGTYALAQKAPAGPVILKGAPMGGVKFDHKTHATVKCESCHHAAKAEKAPKAPQEACTDCHTKVAAAPMKTKLQAAFHNPTAKGGLCIDCHTMEAGKGKPAPTKCADCHKKENA
jgi:Na+-translocating ferredoxin:NAD+ oxidoreductase RnfC subunit